MWEIIRSRKYLNSKHVNSICKYLVFRNYNLRRDSVVGLQSQIGPVSNCHNAYHLYRVQSINNSKSQSFAYRISARIFFTVCLKSGMNSRGLHHGILLIFILIKMFRALILHLIILCTLPFSLVPKAQLCPQNGISWRISWSDILHIQTVSRICQTLVTFLWPFTKVSSMKEDTLVCFQKAIIWQIACVEWKDVGAMRLKFFIFQ